MSRSGMKHEFLELRQLIHQMTELVKNTSDEAQIVKTGKELLRSSLLNDAWLPEELPIGIAETYSQFLIYCDPEERFSVVLFVWRPGQQTPIHNHTVWGLVGVLRGEEQCDEYGMVAGMPTYSGVSHRIVAGEVEAVSPALGDWHQVKNCSAQTSISIHIYGANIGKRRRQKINEKGFIEDFISGYLNESAWIDHRM